MKLQHLILANCVLAVFGAIQFIFMPEQLLIAQKLFERDAVGEIIRSSGAIMRSRESGICLFSLMLVFFLLRNSTDENTRKVLSIGGFVIHVLTLGMLLIQLSRWMSVTNSAIFGVALMTILAAGYGYFWISGKYKTV